MSPGRRPTRGVRAAALACGLVAVAAVGVGCALPWTDGGDADRTPAADAASAATAGAADDAVDEAAASIETEAALAALERMAAFLAAQPSIRFLAEAHYDAIQPTGQRIEFGNRREIVLRRPDRLRIDVVEWDGPRELVVYDGRAVWLASPSHHAYARAEASGDFSALLERLTREHDLPTPFAELLAPDLASRLRPALRSGARVGRVRIDDRLCDQLAFRAGSFDFQIFVDAGDEPVPRRLVIDYLEEPGRPQFRAQLEGWRFGRGPGDAFFEVAPPIGAQRLPFGELLERMLEPAPGPFEPPATAAGRTEP